MQVKERPDMFRPVTVWSVLAEFDHDQREVLGKIVHSYLCRRCRLELLLRQVTDQLGSPPADHNDPGH
jgi:hypothetical protein